MGTHGWLLLTTLSDALCDVPNNTAYDALHWAPPPARPTLSLSLSLSPPPRVSASPAVVSEEDIARVVADLSKDDDDIAMEAVQIVSAFDCPWIKFNSTTRAFFLEKKKRHLHAPAASKGHMYRDRFSMLHQRVMRHNNFCKPLHSQKEQDYLELTPLESLLGSDGESVVMGMLTQQDAGVFFLEDGTLRERLPVAPRSPACLPPCLPACLFAPQRANPTVSLWPCLPPYLPTFNAQH